MAQKMLANAHKHTVKSRQQQIVCRSIVYGYFEWNQRNKRKRIEWRKETISYGSAIEKIRSRIVHRFR